MSYKSFVINLACRLQGPEHHESDTSVNDPSFFKSFFRRNFSFINAANHDLTDRNLQRPASSNDAWSPHGCFLIAFKFINPIL